MTNDNNNQPLPQILICMATYNGERYLEQQLESLCRQTCQDFLLFVHDDGSTDNTGDILKAWERSDKLNMVVLDDGLCFHASSKNFVHLLSQAEKRWGEFPYYMFCDQDDIWKDDKIAVTLKRMKKAEKKYKQPILVHTDLEVVDSDLHSIAPSYLKYRSINPCIKKLNRLLIQNNVTGCTMMWNQKLNQVLNWKNVKPAMHDWWITLIASLFGQIVFLDRTTILYRQHEDNVVGATKVKSISFVIHRLSNLQCVRMKFRQAVQQAGDLLKIYGPTCDKEEKMLLRQFSRLYDVNKFKRTYLVVKYKFFKQSLIQIIGELLFI